MNETSRQKLTAPIRRVRFVYVAMIFCFWAGAIAVRLTWLQVVQHSDVGGAGEAAAAADV